jgi:hypothetical protein
VSKITNKSKITQRIPDALTRLEEEKDRANKSKAKAKRRSDFWKGGAVTASTGAAVIAATLAFGIPFPHGLVVLPVVLPILSLIGVMAGNHALQKAARERRVIQYAIRILY